MKILIIALSGAGDVLMSTPLIKELRLAYKKAQIDCLVMQENVARDVLKNNKDLSRVIYFNFRKEGMIKSLSFCKKLKNEKYDLSITVYPQARYEYSLVSYLIHAKERIGFSYENHKFELNSLLFTKLIKENFKNHVVINNLKVLDILGIKRKTINLKLVLNLSKEDINFSDRFFKSNKIKKAAVIHAGSGTTKSFILKRWPKEKFAELCKKLSGKKYKIIFVGGPEETNLKKEIIQMSGLTENSDIFMLNEDINRTAAVIKKSKIVVSNDTIIGHVAAAVGTKVISLFGPTSPENTAPFTKNKIIICKRPENVRPFMHGKNISQSLARHMGLISVEDVSKHIQG